MFKKLKNKKGFTLIEIIVVIVILAVLMAVAVPSVMSYMNEGKNAKYQTVGRAVLINAQTEYAKAVADGQKYDEAIETVKSNVVAKHNYNGADKVIIENNDDITLTGTDKDDAAERDVAQVICKIKIDGNDKYVTVKTNKNVTVSDNKPTVKDTETGGTNNEGTTGGTNNEGTNG